MMQVPPAQQAHLQVTQALITMVQQQAQNIEALNGQVLNQQQQLNQVVQDVATCLLYTSPSPRDGLLSRMPSSA